jgi:hypothetical protein
MADHKLIQQSVKFAQCKTKFSEVIEWVYLECWLLCSTTAGSGADTDDTGGVGGTGDGTGDEVASTSNATATTATGGDNPDDSTMQLSTPGSSNASFKFGPASRKNSETGTSTTTKVVLPNGDVVEDQKVMIPPTLHVKFLLNYLRSPEMELLVKMAAGCVCQLKGDKIIVEVDAPDDANLRRTSSGGSALQRTRSRLLGSFGDAEKTIALLPLFPGAPREPIPVHKSFVLALLRRLRRISAPQIVATLRQMLTERQQKDQNGRDTELAMHVSIVEEELFRERINVATKEAQAIQAAIDAQEKLDREKLEAQQEQQREQIQRANIAQNLAKSTSAGIDTAFESLQVGGGAEDVEMQEALLASATGNTAANKKTNADKADDIGPRLKLLQVETACQLPRLYHACQQDANFLIEKLRSVAKFRSYLREYVQILMNQYDIMSADPEWNDVTPEEFLITKLCAPELENAPEAMKEAYPVRSLRMLALKEWERAGGSGQLQAGMGTLPLSDPTKVKWFDQWKSDGKAQDLTKFLGGSKLPVWNPFLDFNVNSEYQEADKLVGQYALTKEAGALDTHFFEEMTKKTMTVQRRRMGGLALRLCSIGLDHVVMDKLPEWCETLQSWLRTQSLFTDEIRGCQKAMPAGYKNLLLYLSGEPKLKAFLKNKAEPRNATALQRNPNIIIGDKSRNSN